MADRSRRPQLHRLLIRPFLAAEIVAALAVATSAAAAATPTATESQASLARLVGQTILVRMPGRVPTASFLTRVRRGQIGGVVLFQENYGASGPSALVSVLQDAARAGGNPPLLIAIDQEGGIVKRLPGAPTLAPPQMVTPTIANQQGLATAKNLAANGVNVDLAPVFDVARGGFITPRSFGSTPSEVASRGVAFARGLLAGGILPTAKHFPGLGYATTTTDTATVVVQATHEELDADLAPFRAAIRAGVPIVLVSTAIYPRLGDQLPAACSAGVVEGLLRRQLGFQGLVITDALDTPAVTTELTVPDAALAAVKSGADMVLAAGTTSRDANQVSEATYNRLLAAATDGQLSRTTLQLAYQHIIALKQRLRPSSP